MISIHFDITPFKRLERALKRNVMTRRLHKQWSKRYSAFVRKRFRKQGDGSWKPLAASTIRRRRKKSDVPLRDTGTLFAALSIGAPGNLSKRLRNATRFGFRGKQHKGGRATLRQIAVFHQTGAGNNPKREILVLPNPQTMKGMQRDLAREINRLGLKFGGRAR